MTIKQYYVPCTPGGTDLWELRAITEEQAWAKLMKAVIHMSYANIDNLKHRGYTVSLFKSEEQLNDHTAKRG